MTVCEIACIVLLIKSCRKYNLCPFWGGPGCILGLWVGLKHWGGSVFHSSCWFTECNSTSHMETQSYSDGSGWTEEREGRVQKPPHPHPLTLLGPVNDVRFFSPGPLTFWQPPANSILQCRSRRTMWLRSRLNEVLPPTVWLFSGSLGTSFWAHCPSLWLLGQKGRAGKGRG